MQFWFLLQDNMSLALVVFGVLGLCIGSFLNVLIYRMPIMMNLEWRESAVDILEQQTDIRSSLLIPIATIVDSDPTLSLSYPASHCPHCDHRIRWYENLPVISWVALRGHCSSCQQSIKWRYPFIELLTAILSILVVLKFGVTLIAMAALILVWTLIALAAIDFDTQYLPDRLTYPLAGLGLAVNSQSWFVSPEGAIWGLIIGYLVLWIVIKVFYLVTKKQGMGQGDFKLLAVLGAWLGPLLLPFIILLSSLMGTVVGILLLKRHGESRPFAFGPYIAIAGIIALLWGSSVMQWYLGLSGLQ